MTFEELRLIAPLCRAVRTVGYTDPTPVQQQTIPHILDGKDILGCAQTGTGKTAAFALPILQRLSQTPLPAPGSQRPVRALVLSPTRELAAQIGDSFRDYGQYLDLRQSVVFGGVGQGPQEAALRRGIDILVATPGRLLDLMNQGVARLGRLEVLVLDEADRMLDMGFIHDVRRIIAALPKARQVLLFSATMPRDIEDLAARILTTPVRVEVTPVASTVELIDQSVYFVEKNDKRALLQHVLSDPTMSVTRALVFTRTKHGADKVADFLWKQGRIMAQAIHGNKTQGARERALAAFRSGATRVLIATDIAARGIDVDGISHVINFDLPNISESYVHRIGRTARAGASGIAVSFCDRDERPFLADIERLIRKPIAVVGNHPFKSLLRAPLPEGPRPTSGATRNRTYSLPAGRSQPRSAPRAARSAPCR